MALLERIATATAPRHEIRRNYDPVSASEFFDLLAGRRGVTKAKSGVSVGPERALGITAWFSGVRYLSESVAGLPWHHYLRLPNDERDRRADQTWLAAPDFEQTWFGLVEHWMMSLLHHGNGFAWKLRNPAGQVYGLREIFPDRVTGGIAPDGHKRFLIDRDPTVYTTRDVLHIPGLAYKGRFGMNPIQKFANALGTVAAADDYAGTWFGSNTHVGGIISVPQELDDDEAKLIKNRWDQFHQGLLNAHQTGVLSHGATYNRITLSAEDAQLIESRQFGVAEIARMLRIPPHKLYDLTRSTNNNIEHQSIEATTDSVRPWTIRIETAINADRDLMLPGHYVEATLEGLLRGDSAAQAASYTAGVNGGWLTPGAVARKQNEPSPPELDYYLRPLNMDVIRLGEAESEPTEATVAETVQKVYLGVTSKVITVEEARKIINDAGGSLAVPAPRELTQGAAA